MISRVGCRSSFPLVPLVPIVLVVLSIACTEEAVPKSVRITCVGDSITYGVDGDALRANPIPFGTPRRPPVDRLGGYPGRLGRRLGTRAEILNRGIPGSTTAVWLDELRDGRIIDPAVAPDFTYVDLVRRVGWDGFDFAEAMQDAQSLLLATLRADRPDVMILLLGVNDLLPGLVAREPGAAKAIVSRIGRLRRQAESQGYRVLVSSLLPTERDSLAEIDRVNSLIRLDHPDFLPLGAEFAAEAWRDLLSDGIHPSEAGYELIAEIVEDQLVARGLISPSD